MSEDIEPVMSRIALLLTPVDVACSSDENGQDVRILGTTSNSSEFPRSGNAHFIVSNSKTDG